MLPHTPRTGTPRVNSTMMGPGPSITELMATFVAGLPAPRREAARRALDLLAGCLDHHGPRLAGPRRMGRVAAEHAARGNAPGEFCEEFGAEWIGPALPEFLGGYLIHNLGQHFPWFTTAVADTEQFVLWLGAQGELAPDRATEAAEIVHRSAAPALRAAQAAELMREFLDDRDEPDPDALDGDFTITDVVPGLVWLAAVPSGERCGPIALPPAVTGLLEVEWELRGMLARRGGAWELQVIENVFPALPA